MSGGSGDYGPANEALATLLGVPTRNFNDEVTDGVRYSWHHHEDGKHMILVPRTLNGDTKNLRHLGGSAVIKQNLKGYFPDPFEAKKFLGRCKN